MVKNTHSLALRPVGSRNMLWWLLKLIIAVVSCYYLYRTVFVDVRFRQTIPLTLDALKLPYHIGLLGLAITLIFLNWGFETWKWHFLIAKFQHISVWRAYRAVLAGTAVSWWMPNRAGEYFGRIFFIRSGSRIKGVLATFLGSVSQLLITLILGTLALLSFIFSNVSSVYLWAAIGLLGVISVILLLLFYFNINQVRFFLPGNALSRLIRKYALVYSLYSKKELQKILLFSFLRYLVFSFQFYILLIFYGIHVPLHIAAMLIFLMFFIQTAIPTSGFGELMVRGGAAVYLFHAYSSNVSGIVAASYTLWIINVLLPGLIGAIILTFARINRKWAL